MSTWETAKAVLNASDLQRLACCYFYSDHTKIDYDSASRAYGSASANSFRVMLQAAVRKVREAEAAGGGAGAGAEGLGLTTPTKGKGGRKRKGAAEDGVEVGSPTKKRGRATQKRKKVMDEEQGNVDEEGETDEGANVQVKEEGE